MKTARYVIDGRDWGPLPVLRPLPIGDDPWGCLAPLKGTPLGDMIPVVSGFTLSEALHGNPYPLVKVIGPTPRDQLRLVPKGARECGERKACALWDPKKCFPRPKLPECYVSPLGEAATEVILTWVENCYVLIVAGGEFSLG